MTGIGIETIFHKPIVRNTTLVIKGIYALVIQNAGNTEISINEDWTIKPGGTLSLGNDYMNPASEDISWNVRFSESSTCNDTPNNRMEIIYRKTFENVCI